MPEQCYSSYVPVVLLGMAFCGGLGLHQRTGPPPILCLCWHRERSLCWQHHTLFIRQTLRQAIILHPHSKSSPFPLCSLTSNTRQYLCCRAYDSSSPSTQHAFRLSLRMLTTQYL